VLETDDEIATSGDSLQDRDVWDRDTWDRAFSEDDLLLFRSL